MNKILSKTYLSDKIVKLEVEAPLIAKASRPGNFVIVRVGEKGERKPLTITGTDPERGSISLVVKEVGVSFRKLGALEVGEEITDLVGPLGKPARIEKMGTVLACGGGVGIASLLPLVRAFKNIGNRVISVLGGSEKDSIILENEIRALSDELVIMTDDGSYGKKGSVTDGMEEIIGREKIDYVVTIGSTMMMKSCEKVTRKYNIPTVASLNTLMVDGIGMCGACRVTVGNKTLFTCVDGPEFDAHQINFDEILSRWNVIEEEETEKQRKVEVQSNVLEIPMDVSDRNEPWRQELRGRMPAKERTAIERVVMPEVPLQERMKGLYIEVNQGLTAVMAMREAARCMDCVNPTCMQGVSRGK